MPPSSLGFDPMQFLEMVDGRWQANERGAGLPLAWLLDKAGLT
jgi:hypothetical protein